MKNIIDEYRQIGSHTIDSIKTLRSNIQFSSVDKPLKTIVMTSSIPNEGKSTLSSYLAMAMAENGSKTLIVEADYRNPSLRKMLKFPKSYGMVHYLSGLSTLEKSIVETSFPNLFFLDSEEKIINPVEIISSHKFKTMIEELRNMFDYVIFDTPPLGAFIDSALIAAQADATIIVVKDNCVDKSLFKKVVEQLEKANANILGVIYNEVESTKMFRYYDKYYKKYYQAKNN